MDKHIPPNFWKGQVLEILTPDEEFYFTQILEYEPSLLVKQPVNKESLPMTIESSMPVTVYFQDHQKEIYSFDTMIFQLQSKKFVLKKPSIHSLKKAERRRYFRILVAVNMSITIQSEYPFINEDTLHTNTYDISGGGLSFLHPTKPVEVGMSVHGKLFLVKDGKHHEISFKGKAVKPLRLGNGMYKISLQFVDMEESKRSEIIRFCMYKQIELRNKLKGAVTD